MTLTVNFVTKNNHFCCHRGIRVSQIHFFILILFFYNWINVGWYLECISTLQKWIWNGFFVNHNDHLDKKKLHWKVKNRVFEWLSTKISMKTFGFGLKLTVSRWTRNTHFFGLCHNIRSYDCPVLLNALMSCGKLSTFLKCSVLCFVDTLNYSNNITRDFHHTARQILFHNISQRNTC